MGNVLKRTFGTLSDHMAILKPYTDRHELAFMGLASLVSVDVDGGENDPCDRAGCVILYGLHNGAD